VTDLVAVPLTREAFAPFGEVIELSGARHWSINAGYAERFHDLCAIDVGDAGGRVGLSIFAAKPRPVPVPLTLMERHPLGSQAFLPMGTVPFVIVVAPPGDVVGPLSAFVTDGRQGCNYAKGVWHHPLIVTGHDALFAVIDRIGPGANLDERPIADTIMVRLPAGSTMAVADTATAPPART
jgi:ureidoglycolate lyase